MEKSMQSACSDPFLGVPPVGDTLKQPVVWDSSALLSCGELDALHSSVSWSSDTHSVALLMRYLVIKLLPDRARLSINTVSTCFFHNIVWCIQSLWNIFHYESFITVQLFQIDGSGMNARDNLRSFQTLKLGQLSNGKIIVDLKVKIMSPFTRSRVIS